MSGIYDTFLAIFFGFFDSDLLLEFGMSSNAIACRRDGSFDSGQRRNSRHHSWAARVQLLPISWELALKGGLERPVTECLAYFFKVLH